MDLSHCWSLRPQAAVYQKYKNACWKVSRYEYFKDEIFAVMFVYVQVCVFSKNICRYWGRQGEGSVIWQGHQTSSWWPSTSESRSQPIPARGAHINTHTHTHEHAHTITTHSHTAKFHWGVEGEWWGCCSCQYCHLILIWLKGKRFYMQSSTKSILQSAWIQCKLDNPVAKVSKII